VNLINEKEIIKAWANIVESATGITDKSKLSWLSIYSHFHNQFEEKEMVNESALNYVHLNPNMNLNGMGAVTLPGNPGLTTAFPTQTHGSGDKPYSLLPLAMQVAAQTVGLDLVPVIPMNGPFGMLTYLDFVYTNGKLDSKENPLMIKVPTAFTTAGGLTTFTVNTTYYVQAVAGTSLFRFTYIGASRIDAYPIFKVVACTTAGVALEIGEAASTTVATAVATAGIYNNTSGTTQLATFTGSAELVKALEDHIPAYSGRGLRLGAVDDVEPYSRGEAESTPDNLMGLTLYNKSVEAKGVQASAAVTREQVQDLKQFGIDAVAQVEAALINDLTQTINKEILDRLFKLGVTNHKQINTKDGSQFNLLFNTTGTAATVTLGTDWVGTSQSISSVPAVNVSSLTGGETQGTLQRRILSKILAASSMISIRGRRGSANFAVTNGQVGTALQDIAGFQAYPLSNTINQNNGSLYPVGSVAGVTVYVDPNMGWNDCRVCVGRKGDGNSPGVVFMPYIMADPTSVIAEGTMAPKISVKSRFALVDAGQHPQTMYLTFKVELNGYNLV